MHKSVAFFRRILFVSCFILCVITQSLYGQSSAPSDSLQKALINKEIEMFNAICTGDKPSTEKLVGEDYVTINADGVMQDKVEMMKAFGKFKGSTFELSEKRIRTYGNLSIITGRAKFYIKSILAADVLYTETWIYRDNKFYFIGWQGTMTGLPSYYSLIVTIIGLVILYFIARLIIRKTRKSKRQSV